MDKETTRSAPTWRHKLPLVIGVCLCGLVFIYLVLPGVLLGLLIRTGVIDPTTDDPATKNMIETAFFIPVFIGNRVGPIGEFYEWQMRFVGGDP